MSLRVHLDHSEVLLSRLHLWAFSVLSEADHSGGNGNHQKYTRVALPVKEAMLSHIATAHS